ncbi:MAG: SDR family NAD(P)-dependent oxidoreductase [Acidobacteriota bacterium]|nr:SDR family NAD(P)-dependent oxidoreductase [Acidobacteriota bacterium]
MTTKYDDDLDQEAGADQEAAADRAIAIVGMAGRFPKAPDLDAFWSNLRNGVEAMEELTDDELRAAGVDERWLQDPSYVKVASRLDDVDAFDAELFGYTAREAEILDPQQRIFLEQCWHALEDAGIDPARAEGLIGVYAGVAWNTYLLSNLVNHRELFDGAGGFQVFITNDKDFMPTRVAYKLDLKGPAMVVQTSCSTSLVAAHQACLALQSYECDVALAGGVTVRVPQDQGYVYLDGGLASPDGRCRSFDAQAAGTIFGSGVGVVVLKRLEDAVEDGDVIRGVILGSAINNDGSVKVSYTAPSVEGQAWAVANAQAVAGVDARTVQYVEAHGTATSLGDPIEVTALTKVFRESTPDQGFCALGSVKSNLGHLDAAAGVAGLIKTTLALEHREIPPSLHYQTPNPAIDFESSPFFVTDSLKPWPEGVDGPRRAGVSSFGVGGTNAHAVVEEAPPREAGDAEDRGQLLVVSAASAEALERSIENLAEHLAAHPELDAADVAWSLQTGRAVLPHRAAAVLLPEQTAAVLQEPARWLRGVDAEAPRQRPVAFLFSGQGSQHLDMARGLYETEEVFRQALDEVLAALRPHLDRDLAGLVFPPEAERESARELLYRTRYTQPALFAVEHALAQLWRSWGVVPAAVVGHSIGQYAAAVEAGVFSLADAARLVAVRGRLMDELPAGSMVAVPLAEEGLRDRLPAELDLAAVNETERCVVSGPSPAVEAFVEVLRGEGIGARELHTSHAFHSSMMEPILDAFRQEVEKATLNPPELPLVSDQSGTWATPEELTDPAYWARHLRQPVRFAEALSTLLEEPDRFLLEVGPGQTLATLARRHGDRGDRPVAASLPPAREEADAAADQRTVLEALGRLWTAGYEMDWPTIHGDARRLKVRLPLYPFERRRFWIDAGTPPPVRRAPLSKIEDEGQWFLAPAWRPAPRGETDEPREDLPQRWLMVMEEGGAATLETAGEALAAAGCEVLQVRLGGGSGDEVREEPAGVFHLNRASAAGWGELARLLGESDRLPGGILYAPMAVSMAASMEDQATGEDFDQAQARGFFPLLELLRAFGPALSGALSGAQEGVELWLATAGACAVGPAESPRAAAATLQGLARVLPQEAPAVRCRVVDLDPAVAAAEVGESLGREVLMGSGDERIALRAGRRFVPSFEPVLLPEVADLSEASEETSKLRLRPGGRYLVTGGLQGNGYALARRLADLGGHLALLEPVEPEAESEAQRRLEALSAGAGEVRVFPARLDDSEAVAAAVSAAAQWRGGLDGVLHTAGTDGERTFRALRETGAEEAGWHFGPRGHGTLALAAALDGLPAERQPTFVVLLSSLASELGGMAYGAYAAANAFLDAFAQARCRKRGAAGPRWLALGWDVWELEGEERQITALRPELAALAMTPDEGWRAFRRAVEGAGGEPRILVSTGDLEERLADRRRQLESHRGSDGAGGESRPHHPRPALSTPFADPESDLEKRIAAVWQDLLGFEAVGLDDNFFELGGDSFVAIRVADRLQSELGVELPVARLYEGLTVRALAELLGKGAEEERRERAEHLQERRESADRRRAFLQRRRGGRRGDR